MPSTGNGAVTWWRARAPAGRAGAGDATSLGADLTLALLYLAFVVILFTLSLGYAQAATPWWYWLLPLALPALGLAAQRLHALRRGMAGRHW